MSLLPNCHRSFIYHMKYIYENIIISKCIFVGNSLAPNKQQFDLYFNVRTFEFHKNCENNEIY